MNPLKDSYTHIGSDRYCPALFSPIHNRTFMNKPEGGLWATPDSSNYNWKKWCKDNDFSIDYSYYEHPDDVELGINKSFKFKLKDGARVLVISSFEDLDSLSEDYFKPAKNLFPSFVDEMGYMPNITAFGKDHEDCYLDFVGLSKDYDALIVHYFSDLRVRQFFYGWDLDSILIMNPDVVEQVN